MEDESDLGSWQCGTLLALFFAIEASSSGESEKGNPNQENQKSVCSLRFSIYTTRKTGSC